MWVLIIVAYFNSGLATVPGFRSEQSCIIAGKQIVKKWHNGKDDESFGFQCVAMNGRKDR